MRHGTTIGVGMGMLCAFALAVPAYADNIEERMEALESEVSELRTLRAEDQETIGALRTEIETTNAEWATISGEVVAFDDEGASTDGALANFVISGYGDVKFMSKEMSPSSFQLAHFNPIFLYRMGERLSWVAELEFEPRNEEELEIALEYAYFNYVINDWLSVQGGKFFLPLGIFNPRLHPAWINKLPTRPVIYESPTKLSVATDVGFMLTGAHHFWDVGGTDPVVNYALAVTNGPWGSGMAPTAIKGHGLFEDTNSDKAVSGRIGVIPWPGFEVGFSGLTGEYLTVGNSNFDLWMLDFSKQFYDGLVDIRAEFLRSTQERAGLADINRQGWWIQSAVRLAMFDQEQLKKTELVLRYGRADSNTPILADMDEDNRENVTFGINYYVLENFIVRVAYDWNWGNTAGTNADLFTTQVAFGF